MRILCFFTYFVNNNGKRCPRQGRGSGPVVQGVADNGHKSDLNVIIVRFIFKATVFKSL